MHPRILDADCKRPLPHLDALVMDTRALLGLTQAQPPLVANVVTASSDFAIHIAPAQPAQVSISFMQVLATID